MSATASNAERHTKEPAGLAGCSAPLSLQMRALLDRCGVRQPTGTGGYALSVESVWVLSEVCPWAPVWCPIAGCGYRMCRMFFMDRQPSHCDVQGLLSKLAQVDAGMHSRFWRGLSRPRAFCTTRSVAKVAWLFLSTLGSGFTASHSEAVSQSGHLSRWFGVRKRSDSLFAAACKPLW